MFVALSSCSKKADVEAQVSELEKAFPAAETNAYVNLALTAVRTNDYAGGVVVLQALKRMPGATAEQLMAAQKAIEAITADLVARAARGDAKAKADLEAIERARSQ